MFRGLPSLWEGECKGPEMYKEVARADWPSAYENGGEYILEDELHCAAGTNDLNWMLDCLDRGFPVNGFSQNPYFYTPIHVAFAYRNLEAFLLLMKKGASWNTCGAVYWRSGLMHSYWDRSPFGMIVVHPGLCFEDFTFLLSLGADPFLEFGISRSPIERLRTRTDHDALKSLAFVERMRFLWRK